MNKRNIIILAIGIGLVILGIVSFLGYIFFAKCRIKSNSVKQENSTVNNLPNILLITVCSLRQDHLGCYGYQRNTTPNIDRLAETSIVFKDCYTHLPWTIPSTKALLTGKYPSAALDIANEVVLTEWLRSVGYEVFGIMGTYAVKRAKLDIGFDKFYGPKDPGNLETAQDSHTVRASVVADKVIEMIDPEKTGGMPKFVWAFFKDPHWKYLPPHPYNKRFLNDSCYKDEEGQLSINKNYYNSHGGIGQARLRVPNSGEFITDKAYYISQYDGDICYMDREVGRIISHLKNLGEFDDWLIIFLADHGESLGEDNYFFNHGATISNALIKIPLIVKMPGQHTEKIVNDLTSICDIYPTLIDLLIRDRSKKRNQFYGKNFLTQEQNLNLNSNKRALMLANTRELNVKGEKIVGCIWGKYKLRWDLSIDKKRLYDVSVTEEVIKNPNLRQKKIIHKMEKLIKNFFN